MNTVIVKKGDKGYYLVYPVTDSSGVAKDLTGYTATLKVWKPGDPETLILSGTCSLSVTPTDGIVSYLITATDFTVGPVRYQAEIELTIVGVIESTETFKIVIEESG